MVSLATKPDTNPASFIPRVVNDLQLDYLVVKPPQPFPLACTEGLEEAMRLHCEINLPGEFIWSRIADAKN